MVMYWERCDFCGRVGSPVRSCKLHDNDNVCVICCLLCRERGHCKSPSWLPELRARPRHKDVEEKFRSVLEELLKTFEA